MWRQQLSVKGWHILLSLCLTPFLFWSASPCHHYLPATAFFSSLAYLWVPSLCREKCHVKKTTTIKTKQYRETCNALAIRKIKSWVPFWQCLQTHCMISGKIQPVTAAFLPLQLLFTRASVTYISIPAHWWPIVLSCWTNCSISWLQIEFAPVSVWCKYPADTFPTKVIIWKKKKEKKRW